MPTTGNITNAEPIYQELIDKGYIFKYRSPTSEVAPPNLILSSPEKDMVYRISYAIRGFRALYSMVIMTKDTLNAVRDPLGVRPLSLGTIGKRRR